MGTLSVFLDVPLDKKNENPLDLYKEDPHPQKVLLGHAGMVASNSAISWL